MNSPKKRSHTNAGQRVFRIIHTHGALAGRTSIVDGREFGLYVTTGSLIQIGKRLARVAVGLLAYYDSEKKNLSFIVYAPMVLNWDIIEKAAFHREATALTKQERDDRMRNGKPLVDAQPAIIEEKRRRIGGIEFVKSFGIGITLPVW